MANPRIVGGRLVASGTGAIGIDVQSDTDLSHIHEITATAPINILLSATANVIGCRFDPTAVTGSGTLNSLSGDRAVRDALGYQARHANDIDNAAGIHHTLPGLSADSNLILATQIFGG